MKILIVGAGGREHALAWKCRQSQNVSSVFVTPGNDGMETIAECWKVKDYNVIVEKAQEYQVDLAVIGQEDYLVNGLKEKLEQTGIRVIGPNPDGARLEGSKVFAKQFMERHGIPTADFQVFDNRDAALKFISGSTFPIVIKADGLATGKGVQVCENLASATDWVDQLMVEKKFGSAGDQIVVEAFISGNEVSWFELSDGETHRALLPSQDYKKQLNGGKGPNTGGMGCYAPVSFIDSEMADRIRQEIVIPTFNGLKKEGIRYEGILYFGLMIDSIGPKLLEYNVRLGDPECQTLMPLLDSDIADIFKSIVAKKLDAQPINWKKGSAVTIILASENYPYGGSSQACISGLDSYENFDNTVMFHAATEKKGDRFFSNGGRVLGVTAIADSIQSARSNAYQVADQVSWNGMQYRTDIAKDLM